MKKKLAVVALAVGLVLGVAAVAHAHEVKTRTVASDTGWG